jgi:ATP-dependent Clp protease ATP-binding subunit ClpA
MKTKTFLVIASVVLISVFIEVFVIGTENEIEVIRLMHQIKKHLAHPDIGDLSFIFSIIGIVATLSYVAIRLNRDKAKQNTPAYDLDLESLPAFERAKKKLELYDLTKDEKYLLTPEESNAFLQRIKESKEPIVNPPKYSDGSVELDVDDLEEYLKSKIVGQDNAIRLLTDGIYQQAKAGNNNLGSYLFVGQTGVGKTETAKALAEYLKPYGYAFYRFDMNNFTEAHTASTLLGAPKGYVGSEDGGLLPRKLLENPRAVILFDEIEKAHPSLYRIFMTLIDEGSIQEVTTGMRVSTKDAIFIFTSNLYQETISAIVSTDKDDVEKELAILDVLTGKIPPLPTDYLYIDNQSGIPFRFPAEFVARLTKIIPFRKLGYEDLEKIAIRLANGDEAKAKELTRQFYPLAEKYGVRVFVKKVKEML